MSISLPAASRALVYLESVKLTEAQGAGQLLVSLEPRLYEKPFSRLLTTRHATASALTPGS